MNLLGVPLRIADTAGLRETEDEVERIGVARTQGSVEKADLVLLILDAAAGETPEDAALRQSLTGRPHLIVWNKWDVSAQASLPLDGSIAVSALTGWNLEALESALAEKTLSAAAGPESALVTQARHKQALEAASAQIDEAARSLHTGLPADFASIDLRGALTSLGMITGETATEDVIAEIFSRFCIGK